MMGNKFEEYKMNIIRLEGDIICTSWNHASVEDGGDLTEGNGDEDFDNDLGVN